MGGYALRRLLGAIPTLLVLVTLVFFLLRLAPGGPFDRDRLLPPGIEAVLRQSYHLDDPLWRQYLRYVGGVLRGDFGPSFQYSGFSVTELVGAAAPVSLKLGFAAMLLATLVGGAAGIVAALNRDGVLDRLLMALALGGISLPSYVTAPLLILLFAVWLPWLPAGGWSPGSFADAVLPTATLALPQVAYIARLMRVSMIDVLREPYIRTARAKGMPRRHIVLRHALKPALLPVVSYLGPACAGIVTGSVVVEQIFGIPGLGRYFVQGALNRDYTLVLGVVLFYGALTLLFNLAVDLLYGVLDPRVRHD